ncbi:MAG: efflux RND transporter periplasmic adaptor subunit [Deltaproteobacteria bacterium]|nr:MAG: efflux RND transporter periplasmic adaptor subunit [Deltaproteobacteria bacterium]
MKRVLIPAFVLILILAIGAWYLFRGESEDEEMIAASGTIEVTEIDVSSKLIGKVDEIKVEEGDQVKKGEVLLNLDHRELLIQKKQALAVLGAARHLSAQVEAVLNNLTTSSRRAEKLYRGGSLSQQKYEEITTRLEATNQQYEAAKNQLAQAEAALEFVEIQIDNARLEAPIDGVVLQRNIDVGELAFIGMPLVTLGNLDDVWLEIYIPETRLGRVKLGQKVEITVDSFPDKIYEGKIIGISQEAEFTPKNIQTREERVKLVYGVKIGIKNPLQELKPGMPADARIIIK